MDYKSFIKQTVSCFSLEWIESIEDLILGRFIFYSFISKEEITGNVLAEKLSDYFEKVEIKTGKTFDKLLSLYMIYPAALSSLSHLISVGVITKFIGAAAPSNILE